MNNVIPKELINWGKSSSLKPLSIISKEKWLKKKEEFKLLKNELQQENKDIFSNCLAINNEDKSKLIPGSVVLVTNLPTNTNRSEIKTFISHFVEPVFVDYDSKKNQSFLRFANSQIANIFLSKAELLKKVKFNENIIEVRKLEANEENIYFSKVKDLQKQLKNKNKKYKHK